MYNHRFARGQAPIVVGSLLASVALAALTFALADGPADFPPWLRGLDAALTAAADSLSPTGHSAGGAPADPGHFPVATVLIAYWAVLCAPGLYLHAVIARRRRRARRRSQKERADRLLGRDPDEFPLKDDR